LDILSVELENKLMENFDRRTALGIPAILEVDGNCYSNEDKIVHRQDKIVLRKAKVEQEDLEDLLS
jgi:hypothetical protein